MNVYQAFKYLRSKDLDIQDIMIVLVNPKTNSIDDNESLNSRTRVWLEIGKSKDISGADMEKMIVSEHYWMLDAGGNTFEEALIKSAKKAKTYFGD